MSELRRIQAKIDSNTRQESPTGFLNFDFREHFPAEEPGKIGLCQLNFEYQTLLWNKEEASIQHTGQILKYIRKAREQKIRFLIFPELAFPIFPSADFDKITSALGEAKISCVAGSLLKAPQEDFEQNLLDRLNVYDRRLTYSKFSHNRSKVSRKKEENSIKIITELAGQDQDLLEKINLAKKESEEAKEKEDKTEKVTALPESPFYHNVQVFIKGLYIQPIYKKVLMAEELQHNIAPGSLYAILQNYPANMFFATCSEFMGDTFAGYQGDGKLIRKIFEYLENKPADFYRVDIAGLYEFQEYATFNKIPIMSVISFEIHAPSIFHGDAVALMEANEQPGLFFYTNCSEGGGTAVFVKEDFVSPDIQEYGITAKQQGENGRIRAYCLETHKPSQTGILEIDLQNEGNGSNNKELNKPLLKAIRFHDIP